MVNVTRAFVNMEEATTLAITYIAMVSKGNKSTVSHRIAFRVRCQYQLPVKDP